MRNVITVVIALGLVSAACAESPSGVTSTSVTGATTTTASADPTTADTAETTTTAGSQPGAGGSDCLVGTWVLDSETFVENFDGIFADAGMPGTEVTALEGTFIVEMGADGSLSATRDGWGFNIATGEGTVILEINGTETGTWSADDSTLTVDTDTSDVDMNAAIEVDGEMLEMPAEYQPEFEVPRGIASGSSYTCSGDVLTLINAGVESELHRA